MTSRKRISAITTATMIGLSLGILQPSAAHAASCPSGVVCFWTGANYTGNQGQSNAVPGLCFHNAGPLKSVINRSGRSVTFYQLNNCASGGLSTRTVGPGLSVSNLGITAYSYIS